MLFEKSPESVCRTDLRHGKENSVSCRLIYAGLGLSCRCVSQSVPQTKLTATDVLKMIIIMIMCIAYALNQTARP